MQSKRKIIALIPAAGTGKRMGSPTHKAFLTWQGKSILQHTLDAFQKFASVDEIIVILHPDDMKKGAKLLDSYSKVTACLAGGKERKDSVLLGLQYIFIDYPESVTLIHDAARPLITEGLIKKLVQNVKPGQGAVPGVREANTLKKVKKGSVIGTMDRTDVWEVQTPQCFLTKDILPALEKNINKKLTDDCQAMELSGKKIMMIESTTFNFKITYPEDLELFKLMSERKK